MIEPKSLFFLQTNLIDMKVSNSVNNAIDRFIAELNSFKKEIHKDISSLEQRIIVLETKVNGIFETQKEFRQKFVEYGFKAGWMAMAGIFSYLVIQVHMLVK